MKFKKLLTFITLLLMFLQGTAQTDSVLTRKQRKDLKKAKKIAEGKPIISPLIIPGYSPELKFTLSCGGILSWSNDKNNKDLPRSNMVVVGSFSSTGAMILAARPIIYWAKDKIRISSNIQYRDMPDNYWGIGYKKAIETPASDTTTSYNRKWIIARSDILYRIKNDFFAGLSIDANYTKGSEESIGVSLDENYKKYNFLPFNLGVGPTFSYDSRDVPVNSWKGILINARAMYYNKILGSNNTYQTYSIDYRQYKSIGNKLGRTLAWEIMTRIGMGDMPYGEMSQLGTPFNLRGYIWGKYRDKSMAFAVLEYRHKFYKNDGSPRRSGAVIWTGTGSIFDIEKDNSYNQDASLLPNLGIGYRLELQPRLNLRVDLGFGKQSRGIYVNITEAF